MAQLKNTTVSDTGFLQLPVGTTAQRPAPANGQMRFNTTLGRAEFYNAAQAVWLGTTSAGVLATGGTVYDVITEGTTYRVHVFTNTGNSTFTVNKSGSVDYLIVAGGGAGGGGGGAGGAGGLLTGTTTVTPQSYTITVGAGGVGVNTGATGANGSNSSAFGLTAIGGGGGGALSGVPQSGGSGGGGNRPTPAGGAGTSEQGNAGGNGAQNSTQAWTVGGGGGGAGWLGQNANVRGLNLPGNGGVGMVSLISGIPAYYAGGGGGGTQAGTQNGGTGGLGGGGDGGQGASITSGQATSGTPNTGAGGGSSNEGGSTFGLSGSGGSGIVIIRYVLRDENSVLLESNAQLLNPEIDLDLSKPIVYSGNGTILNNSSTTTPVASLINSPTYRDRRTHRSRFELRGIASGTHLLLTPAINFPFPWTKRIVFINTASTATTDFRVSLTGDPSTSRAGYIRLFNDIIDNTARVRFLFRYRNSAGTWSSHSDYVGPFGSDYVPFAQQDAYWVNNIIDLTVTMSSNQVYRYYINGSQVGSRSRTTSGDLNNELNISMIGARATGTTETLQGSIYLAQFYNIELTATQIQNEFNSSRWRFGL
jgi:hypothetical protein